MYSISKLKIEQLIVQTAKLQQQSVQKLLCSNLFVRYTSLSNVPPQSGLFNPKPSELVNLAAEASLVGQLKKIYGQPTHMTHPHLIKAGDLVVGQTVDEFKQRRVRLMEGIKKFTLDSQKDLDFINHVLVVPSATKKYMSNNIPYFFRQNSDFYYLTGCLEPDSMLMLTLNHSGNIVSRLFMRPNDKQAELWDGPRTGAEDSVTLFGVDESYPISEFEKILNVNAKNPNTYIWFDDAASELKSITESVINTAGNNNVRIHSPTQFLQSMRLFKSPAEMDLMRKTCAIASQAFNETISASSVGQTEHFLNAMIDFKCRMRNASYLAYPPVIAAGNNATTIHYIHNNQKTCEGDLVLMDAGCEYGGYSSDITRTWPISGEFTEPQKVIYDVVLQLQKELISLILKPGGESLDKLFDTMCFKLAKYLQEIGLVSKNLSSERELVREGYTFCPHHVSHYLGMDVHDTPSIPRSLQILPGMVFTVEPGIYIGKNRNDVPQEFRGLGVRIEDDILINSNNNVEILTESCVKERTAIVTQCMVNRAHI